MHTEIRVADQADPRTDDQRWAAWVAKGIENDRTARKHTIVAAAVLASGVGLWLAVTFLRG